MIAALSPVWRRWISSFVQAVDKENIVLFQATYYVLIMIAGLYLLLGANSPPQNVEPVMGHVQYLMWLGLNVICPAMTLVGRRLTKRAANMPAGQPNPAKGAAWLQLVGDAGVWGAVMIYVVCLLATTSWGQGLYGAFFVLMGIPGGAMFTLRSLRRVSEIRRRELRTA